MKENEIQSSGIIIPPRQIREVIEKTARYVFERGPQLEAEILEREKGNPTFAFISFEDPYRPYYDRILASMSNASAAEPPSAATPQPAGPAPEDEPFFSQLLFALQLPKIKAVELAILKKTSRAVSSRGPSFYEKLLSSHSDKLSFLRPSHRLFPLFAALTDQYSSIKNRKNELINELRAEISDPTKLVSRCEIRRDQANSKAEETKRMLVEGRQGNTAVDWDTFVILKTIDFAEGKKSDERFAFRTQKQIDDLRAQRNTEQFKEIQSALANPKSTTAPSTQPQESLRYRCGFCSQTMLLAEYEDHCAKAHKPASKSEPAPPEQSFGTRNSSQTLQRMFGSKS